MKPIPFFIIDDFSFYNFNVSKQRSIMILTLTTNCNVTTELLLSIFFFVQARKETAPIALCLRMSGKWDATETWTVSFFFSTDQSISGVVWLTTQNVEVYKSKNHDQFFVVVVEDCCLWCLCFCLLLLWLLFFIVLLMFIKTNKLLQRPAIRLCRSDSQKEQTTENIMFFRLLAIERVITNCCPIGLVAKFRTSFWIAFDAKSSFVTNITIRMSRYHSDSFARPHISNVKKTTHNNTNNHE